MNKEDDSESYVDEATTEKGSRPEPRLSTQQALDLATEI